MLSDIWEKMYLIFPDLRLREDGDKVKMSFTPQEFILRDNLPDVNPCFFPLL